MASALSFRKAAAIFAVSSLAVVGATSFVAGCSSSSSEDTPDAASQVCPSTLATAIGTKCTTDREVCVVGFICPGELNEIANCTCTAGTWACTDHANNPITDPAAGATCTALGGGNDKACPADEGTASLAPCGTPGLICSYTGAQCAGDPVPNTDQCQCVGNNADGGLEFKCNTPSCIVPSEAGPIIVDAGDAG